MKKKKSKKQNVIYLSDEAFKSFMNILANPTKPNAALKKAFTLHRQIVKRKKKEKP